MIRLMPNLQAAECLMSGLTPYVLAKKGARPVGPAPKLLAEVPVRLQVPLVDLHLAHLVEPQAPVGRDHPHHPQAEVLVPALTYRDQLGLPAGLPGRPPCGFTPSLIHVSLLAAPAAVGKKAPGEGHTQLLTDHEHLVLVVELVPPSLGPDFVAHLRELLGLVEERDLRRDELLLGELALRESPTKQSLLVRAALVGVLTLFRRRDFHGHVPYFSHNSLHDWFLNRDPHPGQDRLPISRLGMTESHEISKNILIKYL